MAACRHFAADAWLAHGYEVAREHFGPFDPAFCGRRWGIRGPRRGSLTMACGWLILADDLTGAADCAVAFGRRGHAAVVTWGEIGDARARRLPVLAYDAASRGLAAEAAARRHADVLERLSEPGRLLFKKIDSTLRGQPAAEMAVALAHLKSRSGKVFGVFAPAFPATGRTTVDGRVLIEGRALEQAEVWRREHSYPNADLVEVLATAGIRGVKVGLATVRGGDLRATFLKLAGEGDVIAVCDAETDHDLHAIAQANWPASSATFFIGSAGLAHALAGFDAGDVPEPPRITTSASGTLIVVGSLAGASRAAARELEATGSVAHFPVAPQMLLNGGAGGGSLAADVTKRLCGGGDALIEIMMDDELDLSLGPRLSQGLGEALQSVAPAIGAFAATGGETAAILLSRFGVNGIRLADEIEPGVSLGLTLGKLSVPVATKAGAFGDRYSLIRISERLRAIRIKGSFT
jgi:D-threonate/D-erythronate kinase